MSFIKTLFKDGNKKNLYGLAVLFAAGIALLVISKTASPNKAAYPETLNGPEAAPEAASPLFAQGYEAGVTKNLEEILSLVEGAGEVRVMLTFSYGSEAVVAVDTVSSETSTKEGDAEGLSRDAAQSANDERTVLARQSDGSEKPVVLKEIMPRAEGAIIVAKGGDDVSVKAALIQAARAVLGVEPHKIQVLKMK